MTRRSSAACASELDPRVAEYKRTLEEVRVKTMRLVEEKISPAQMEEKAHAFVRRTKSAKPPPPTPGDETAEDSID